MSTVPNTSSKSLPSIHVGNYMLIENVDVVEDPDPWKANKKVKNVCVSKHINLTTKIKLNLIC